MSDKPQKVECLSDWLVYYQTLIDDIKYAKRQQWNLCYYALLIFGAIVGLTQIENLNLKNYIDKIKWVAMGLATFTSCFLILFQRDIWRYRKNIKKIIDNKFPNDLADIASYPKASSRFYYIFFLIFSIGIVWTGYVAVWFVLQTL
jgi:hypothetical protein